MLVNKEIEEELYNSAGETRVQKARIYVKTGRTQIEKITLFLEKEHLKLNKKTRIFKNTNNFIFLGRTSKGFYSRYRTVRRKLKKRFYLYKTGKLELSGLANSIICYKNLCGKNGLKNLPF